MQQESTIKLTRKNQGFTIIELLIVIVIIGILVAITAVGYNGMTRQAKEASLKSDLKNAATQLSIEQAKTGSYRGTDGIKTDGGSLPKSPGTTLQYTRSANGTAYCLTATTPGVPAMMVSSDNTAPREGACSGHTGPSTGDSEIANNTPIQDVTSSQCQALPTYTGSNESALRTVTDSRGGTTRSYRIGKLADSNCWMLDNLKLGSTTGTITLTSSDTNLTNRSSFTLPKLTSSTGYSSYAIPYAYGPVPGDTGSGATNYGYLYNWQAAAAVELRDYRTTESGNALNSICPANWRLPRAEVIDANEEDDNWLPAPTNDFANLDKAFGGTGMYADNGQVNIAKWQYTGPFKGVFPGRWTAYGVFEQSSGSFLQASSEWITPYRFGVFYGSFGLDHVSPYESNGDHEAGFAIRCLLN